VSGVDAAALERTLSPFASSCSARQVQTSLEDVFIHLMENSKDNCK
jgi:hypothetical protein